MTARFNEMADLTKKAENSLGSLLNAVEAASGTFRSAGAVLGSVYAPELKIIADSFNSISEKMGKFADENGKTIKTVVEMTGAFVGLKLGFLGASVAMGVLTSTMRLNPLVLFLQAVALAAPLIINNWGEITDFFKTHWENLLTNMSKQFHSFVAMIEDLINGFRSIFNLGDIKLTLPTLPQGFTDGLGGYFSDASNVAAGGMRSPDETRQKSARRSMMQSPFIMQPKPLQIQTPSIVSGGITIDFNNAPPGMRVNPGQISGPLAITPNVGYRSFVNGLD